MSRAYWIEIDVPTIDLPMPVQRGNGQHFIASPAIEDLTGPERAGYYRDLILYRDQVVTAVAARLSEIEKRDEADQLSLFAVAA